MVQLDSQGNLLEVVNALRPLGGFARLRHRRQKNRGDHRSKGLGPFDLDRHNIALARRFHLAQELFRLVEHVTPFVRRLLAERWDPRHVTARFSGAMREAGRALGAAPRLIESLARRFGDDGVAIRLEVREIDAFSRHLESGVDREVEPPHRLEPTRLDAEPPLSLDLRTGSIRAIVWATGFRPDYSWLQVPVLDRRGRLRHDGGVVTGAPGMYAIGLNLLRRRKSSFIHGAEDDARDLTDHLAAYLGTAQGA